MPGMVMAGDMFNYGLKARVDSVCADIAQQVDPGEKVARDLLGRLVGGEEG